MRLLLTAVLALNAGLGGSAFGAEPVALKLNLKTGETYKHRIESSSRITQEVMGMKQETNQSFRFTYTLDVLEKDEVDTARVRITYNHIAADLGMGVTEFSYDSDKPEAEVSPMLTPYTGLAGLTFEAFIEPDSSVRIPDGLSEEEQYGAETFQSMFSQSLALYPDGPVSLGDSWEHFLELDEALPMEMTNTWTLDALDADSATLRLTSAVKPAGGDETVSIEGMEFKLDFDGDQTGTVLLSRSSGWIQHADILQNVTGMLSLVNAPQLPGGMQVPITMRMETKLRSIE